MCCAGPRENIFVTHVVINMNWYIHIAIAICLAEHAEDLRVKKLASSYIVTLKDTEPPMVIPLS